MVNHHEVGRIARLFAVAAFDPAGWMPALTAMASATGSSHGELIVVGGPRSGIADRSWASGGLSLDVAAFKAAGGYHPAFNPRMAAAQRTRTLEIAHETDYDTVRPLLRGDGVREIFHDARIESGCQATLIQDERMLVGLAVLRGGRDGRTRAEDRATFAALMPFAHDAARTHLALERQGAALLAEAFEAMAAAAFLLDGGGRVAALTPAADALLTAGRLRLDGGRLTAPGRRGGAALAAAIGDRLMRGGDRPMPPETVVLPDGSAAPLLADVSALPAREWSFGVAARMLVVVRGGGGRHDAAVTLVRRTWDLSEAEADVVTRLARGESRAGIAVARGVSIETVRAQLKSVYGKLGVAREAELVARAAAVIVAP